MFLTDSTKNVILFCLTLPCSTVSEKHQDRTEAGGPASWQPCGRADWRLPLPSSLPQRTGPGSGRLSPAAVLLRFLWCLRSLQTGETDLWYPYRQVRLIFDILTDRWDRCLYTGTQSLIVVPGHSDNAFQKARIGRDATVLDNRRCVWCSCSPWVVGRLGWRVRREWRTVRVVGNSGRYCGTWAVGLTPPLRRSPRVLTAGMLNASFASEFARFLFSSSRQWTTFPSASSVSTFDGLFASAVTSTSLRLEGRPATDRRRRMFYWPMHTYIYTYIDLYTPIYTHILVHGLWCLLLLSEEMERWTL